MAALKVRSFLPATVQGSPRVDPIAGLTTSVNRLGTVVEDLGKILTGMHQDKMGQAVKCMSIVFLNTSLIGKIDDVCFYL